MKATKITYWISTGIVSLMMTYSAIMYLTNPAIAEGFKLMGFASYFRIELAIAKIIGAIILLAPVFPRIKEWAYAGFTIVFISAFIAHTAMGDPFSARLMPIIFLAILVTSYVMHLKLQRNHQRVSSIA